MISGIINSNYLNEWLQDEVWAYNIHYKGPVDNFLQVAPDIAAYVLNLTGIHRENIMRSRGIIYLLSNIILGIVANCFKTITKQQLPDYSSSRSFPSGYTAAAFITAELLQKEHKNVLPWHIIAGYITLTATTLPKMYSNKYWLSDLIDGTGTGMVSSTRNYWMYPVFFSRIFIKGGNCARQGNTILSKKDAGSFMVHDFHIIIV